MVLAIKRSRRDPNKFPTGQLFLLGECFPPLMDGRHDIVMPLTD